MNKTAQTEFHRLFLIDRLPEPLTPASSHLQIFDNYITGTRLRLRKIRDPYSKEWTRMLQQRFPAPHVDTEHLGEVRDLAETKLAEIHLSEEEYAVFEHLEGREIRKNRYFHEFDLSMFAFDVYLGPRWGLHTARVDFSDRAQMEAFIAPQFSVCEITNDPFFEGSTLVDKAFADVQAEVAAAIAARG